MTIISILLAYLIGSIPFGYIAGFVYGVDIRTKGSCNIGATNVLRVLGKKTGIMVFLLDAAKGVAAVCVVPQCVWSFFQVPNCMCEADLSAPNILAILACAAAVFLGHTFPVWLRFKGGKGVATGLGLAIGIAPLSAGIAFAVWLVIFIIGRYVSLASIIAALTLGAVSWFVDNSTGYYVPALMSVLALFVTVKHRANIKRLLAGTENRFAFSSKK